MLASLMSTNEKSAQTASGLTAAPRSRAPGSHTLELSSFKQTKLTLATGTNQHTVGTTELANAVLTTAVEAWR
jgi:hypothetical protein